MQLKTWQEKNLFLWLDSADCRVICTALVWGSWSHCSCCCCCCCPTSLLTSSFLSDNTHLLLLYAYFEGHFPHKPRLLASFLPLFAPERMFRDKRHRFLQAACRSCHPTNSVKAEGITKHLLHFAWVIDNAKCIVVMRVCVCVPVCLSLCPSMAVRPHNCTDPDVTWGHGRGCPLVLHYWADLQSGHGLRCYGNITRTLVTSLRPSRNMTT